MLDVLAATVPIFLIVAVGYFVTRMGVLKRRDMTVFSIYVVKIALPALVFVNVSGHSLREVFNITWMLVYAIGVVIMMSLARWYAAARGRNAAHATTMAMAMSGTNNGFIGLPIFLLLLPDVAGLAAGMAMIVDNVVILPIILTMYEASTGAATSALQRIRTTVKGVVTHPMVSAIALALIVGAFDLTLPAILERSITIVANSASALALFSIGGMLVGLKIGHRMLDVAVAVGGKLLLMPLLAVGLITVLPMLGLSALDSDLRAASVLTLALPSMSAVAAFAEQYGEGEFGAATVMASTVLSFFTLSACMLGLQTVGWL